MIFYNRHNFRRTTDFETLRNSSKLVVIRAAHGSRGLKSIGSSISETRDTHWLHNLATTMQAICEAAVGQVLPYFSRSLVFVPPFPRRNPPRFASSSSPRFLLPTSSSSSRTQHRFYPMVIYRHLYRSSALSWPIKYFGENDSAKRSRSVPRKRSVTFRRGFLTYNSIRSSSLLVVNFIYRRRAKGFGNFSGIGKGLDVS